MNINFINLIESAIMLAGFYLLYKLVLKKETFFKLNRFYLVSSLLFSITIPFLNFDLFPIGSTDGNFIDKVQSLKQGYVELNEVVVYAYSGKLTFAAILEHLKAIYFLGVIILSAFFLFSLSKIGSIVIRNTSYKISKYRIIETTDNIVPFSLFKWIIINPEKHSSEDIKQIIAHEKIHAFQLHSLDLIFIEVLVILFWFNPFIYWYRKSIREIHEYLADQAVVENGFDYLDYQKLLLNQATGSRFIGLTSRFSNSLSKNRLKMLTMMKSKNISKIKIAIAIPFIAAFIVFFANCETKDSEMNENLESENTIKQEEKKGLVNTEDLTSSEEVIKNPDIMAKFDGKDPDEFRFYIQKYVKYPKTAQEKNVEGKVFVQFVVGSNGEVRDVIVVRGVDEYLDQEALRVVKSSPKWTPAMQDNKPVAVRFTFPINFRLSGK